MKKLVFIRHGKAEELTENISDFERSLVTKGKISSHIIARKLNSINIKPDIIITSPAFRALETALIFAEELGYQKNKIHLNDDFYLDLDLNKLLEILNSLQSDIRTVLLFGHNPVFSDLAYKFSQGKYNDMPKGSSIGINFKTYKWTDVKTGEGEVQFFYKPKELY